MSRRNPKTSNVNIRYKIMCRFPQVICSILEIMLHLPCQYWVWTNIHHVHPLIILRMIVNLSQLIFRQLPQPIILLLKFPYQLILRVLIDLCPILDLLHLVRIHQGRVRFLIIDPCWRYSRNHCCFRVTPQSLLQHPCQLTLSIGHDCAVILGSSFSFASKNVDDFAEKGERFVDVGTFFETLVVVACCSGSFGAGKVNDVDLRSFHISCFSLC